MTFAKHLGFWGSVPPAGLDELCGSDGRFADGDGGLATGFIMFHIDICSSTPPMHKKNPKTSKSSLCV